MTTAITGRKLNHSDNNRHDTNINNSSITIIIIIIGNDNSDNNMNNDLNDKRKWAYRRFAFSVPIILSMDIVLPRRREK